MKCMDLLLNLFNGVHMKSKYVKMIAGLGLLTASAVTYAANTGCCDSIACCLQMLGCC